ncbi:TRAP transporter small permease [Aliihoeflea sp. PC F10.4]
MTAFSRFVDVVSRTAFLLGGIALVLMMLHISLDVLLRLLIRRPLPGTLEITEFHYMVACTFLPLAMIELRRRSISIEVISERFPERVQIGLSVMADTLTALFWGGLAYFAWLEAIRRTRIGDSVDAVEFFVQTWPARWVFAISMILATLAVLSNLINGLQAVRDGRAYANVEQDEH